MSHPDLHIQQSPTRRSALESMSADEGQKSRVARDLPDQEVDALREQLRAERRIAELSGSFLALELDELPDALRDALGVAASQVGADRAQLTWLHRNRDGQATLDRYFWAAPGIEPIDSHPNVGTPHSFSWLRKRLLAGEVVDIPRVEDLPDEAASERQSFLDSATGSYLGIPIRWNGRLCGNLDVRAEAQRAWSDHEVEGLRLMADVLCSVLRRKDAEEARRESADRFQTMAESLQITLFESGPDGRVLYSSPRMPELLGYSNEEARELTLDELVHPDDRAESLRVAREAARNGIGGVLRIRHKDESWRTMEAIGRRYETRSGERRFVTVLRDVTEQHARNAELKLRLQLETLISDLSRRFLSTKTAEIDDVIRTKLESVAQVGGADRAFFVSLPELRRDHPYFFEWRSEAVTTWSSTPSEADAQQYRGFASKLQAGQIVSIPVVADMPDELAAEREAMLEKGIQSYLLVPAVSSSSLTGILCLQCVTQERRWSEHEIRLLQLIANLFTSALRRKRNETALFESEARFRALAENSQDSICEVSAQGRILYASPAYARLVGSERSHLEGRNLYDLAHPEDRDLLRDLVESALCGVVGSGIVFRTEHRDGSWLDIEVTARGFSTALGEPRLVAVLRDVSQRERDRRRLEHQIAGEHEIAELSRFFLDLEPRSTQDATREKLAVAASLAGAERSWMFTVDPRGVEERRCYEWSLDDGQSAGALLPERGDAFAWAMTGLMQGRELNVARVSELPDEASAERDDLLRRGVRSFLAIPLLSGRSFIGLMGFEAMSREQSWSTESVTLLRLVGEIFVSALRREQAEIELERSQNQLLQSQKMEAVGTLAGGIAHDFNNHLAVMLGNARFVAQTTLANADSEVRDALADLQRSAEHCAQLTQALLAFSRRSPVTIQVIEVAEVMGALSDLVRPLLPSSIVFEVECAEPEDTIRADPTQLRQVLINLVVNARDAMPEGGHLRLASSRRQVGTQEAWAMGLQGAGLYVELAVCDDGRGMPEETRSRIFEPFFTTKRLGEGTGLGLATAYGIIQQCQGAIHLESELGVGTTFRVLLPLSQDSVRRLEPPVALDLGPGSETLLLAEDEPAVRRLVARSLRNRGYRVFEAEDGQAGLELAEGEGDEIDLLITDIVMPRMGGPELAGKLQAVRPDLRVLFLSGHAEPRDASLETEFRGARFLQKPFQEEELLREVRFLLDSD